MNNKQRNNLINKNRINKSTVPYRVLGKSTVKVNSETRTVSRGGLCVCDSLVYSLVTTSTASNKSTSPLQDTPVNRGNMSVVPKVETVAEGESLRL